MAARKDKSGGSKPPPRRTDSRIDEAELDSAWFDDEAPTRAKASSVPPKEKTPSKRPSKNAPAPAPAAAAKAAAKTPAAAAKTPIKTPPKSPVVTPPPKPVKLTKSGAERAVDKLLPPSRRQTMEVQVEWLEEITSNTIPVQPEWLEPDEDEPPTMPKGRTTPIPKPPPLPKEVARETKRPSSKPSPPSRPKR